MSLSKTRTNKPALPGKSLDYDLIKIPDLAGPNDKIEILVTKSGEKYLGSIELEAGQSIKEFRIRVIIDGII